MHATQDKCIDTHIRWLIRRDIPEVMAIESASFDFPWSEDELLRFLRQRNCIALVAERGCVPGKTAGEIIGYCVYLLQHRRLEIVNLAVLPTVLRQGIGTAFVHKLLGKLSPTRRRNLTAVVREANVRAQVFFRECGFQCVGIRDQPFDGSEEDGYEFVREGLWK